MGEQTEQGWGVRLAFTTVKGVHEAETARLVTGQPCAGLRLRDQWQRTRPSLTLAQPLIRIGTLGRLAGDLTRRDLLVQAAELRRQTVPSPRGHQQTTAARWRAGDRKPRRVIGVDVPRPPLLKRINAAAEPPDGA
ncbi:hypothetical protein [Streptomyces acidicola]|uniref:hypothetical protein n=1 Tax=Streptomyces acidicola TaxID=2596892 RepID=UPI0038147451